MTNRRPFSRNNEEMLDYNSYYKKKVGLTNYQYALLQNPSTNNIKNNNFLMNDCNSKSIYNYKSYDTLINLSKVSAYLDPSCVQCLDVPVNLMNGLQSELYYNDLYEVGCTNSCIENREEDTFCECTNCRKIPLINNCLEKTGKLFPYGKFNNSIKNPAIRIHSLNNIDANKCQEELECPPYVICQCSLPLEDCECCNYTVTTPFDDESNIKYTENSIADCNSLETLLPYQQLYASQLQEMERQKLQEDKILSEKAVSIYSKFGNNKI